MNKAEKTKIIDDLAGELSHNRVIYLADMGGMAVKDVNSFRRLCFNKNVRVKTIKNTLLKKAVEKSSASMSELTSVLSGSTSIMFSETGNIPAKVIKDFRKKHDKPLLKAAYIEESVFIGDKQLDSLVNLKSKNELIGEVIGLLQSPAKNVISALLSGKNKIAGIVKTLGDRPE